jgi:hypothetical protein
MAKYQNTIEITDQEKLLVHLWTRTNDLVIRGTMNLDLYRKLKKLKNGGKYKS